MRAGAASGQEDRISGGGGSRQVAGRPAGDRHQKKVDVVFDCFIDWPYDWAWINWGLELWLMGPDQ